MITSTTVAMVRQGWGYLVPNDPGNPTLDQFLMALNLVTERFTNGSGNEGPKWLASETRLVINPTLTVPGALGNGMDGYITLPRRYLAVLGNTFCNIPSRTFSQWFEFVDSGPGLIDPAKPALGMLVSDGDGKPTQRIIPPQFGPATPTVFISNPADAGQYVRLFGLDQNGLEIYDNLGVGFNITTAYPFSSSNQLMSVVTGIQGPVFNPENNVYFKGNWQLWINQQGQPPYQIGQYEPTEQIPRYHRYLCGDLNPESLGPVTISILAQRRFIQLVAETDWVLPGDMNALRYGLQASQIDSALDLGGAESQWEAAFSILNAAQRAIRGSAKPVVEAPQWGAPGGWYGGGGYGGGNNAWGFGNNPNAI